MLVCASPDTGPELNLIVPESSFSDSESALPSTRQNVSELSVSTRLHWGQRFMPGLSLLWIVTCCVRSALEAFAKIFAAERPKRKAQGGAKRNPG